jgi:putative flippase GtrA
MARRMPGFGPLASWTAYLRDNRFIRFLITGTINTGVTFLIYVGLVLFMPYAIAYTVTVAIGIGLSYFLNARYVFRSKLNLASALQYPAVYLFQYLLGLVLLYLLVEKAGVSKFLAPLLIVCISIPFTYVLSRYIIARRPSPRSRAQLETTPQRP